MTLVTVVTIVRNGRDSLEKTILSVIGQDYKNIEYILVDGGSTDGTLEIIRRYDDRIDYWLSEPDRGIYDAMNKGTGLASGEWINFMNSGDMFHGNGVVSRIFAVDRSRCDLIYGNDEVIYAGGFSRMVKAVGVEDLWKGMNCSHQNIFTRTQLVREYGFNVDNTICADFELIYRLKNDGRRFVYSDETVAVVQAGGLSDTARVHAIKGHWEVVSSFGFSGKVTLYYLWKIADSVARSAVKRILPRCVIDRITRLKR
jgi:glycosyltransferase involved in cell wall biosynthesis